MKINPEIFRAYDVRGVYPEDINPELAYRLGRGFARFLKSTAKQAAPLRVVVGLDMRGSSPFLARELIRGLNEDGVDVLDVGRVPTPAFYYAVAFKDYSGGVMVTASHNPKQYNGFKFCGTKTVPIGEDSGLGGIKALVVAQEDFGKPVKPVGKTTSFADITRDYVNQELSYLNSGKIKQFKIVADTGNAMGALYLDELFRRVPGDLVRLNWELNGNMPVHEPNPLKVATLQQLQEVIAHEKADFGIATDGDGDRIAFLDEKSQVIPPFIVAGLVAQTLLQRYPGAKIGYDLRSSRVLKEMIMAAGGIPVETRVGHTFIKALMREQDILFAGELSSHYYFRENYNYESPVFVCAELLLLRSELDRPLSAIWEPHLKYAQSGEINFEVADKPKVLESLEKKYADGKVSKLDGLKVDYPDWWFNVRASNTEPLLRLNLEAADETQMKQKLEEITGLIKDASK
jgi:phosphomannomutase